MAATVFLFFVVVVVVVLAFFAIRGRPDDKWGGLLIGFLF